MQKIVVITGANAGVGRATAREFAARGCDVVLRARNQQRLDAIADECRALVHEHWRCRPMLLTRLR